MLLVERIDQKLRDDFVTDPRRMIVEEIDCLDCSQDAARIDELKLPNPRGGCGLREWPDGVDERALE